MRSVPASRPILGELRARAQASIRVIVLDAWTSQDLLCEVAAQSQSEVLRGDMPRVELSLLAGT